jgi:hypothetical protein
LEEEVLKNAFRRIIQAKKIAQSQPEQLKSNRTPIGVSHNRSEIKRTNQDTDRDNSKRDPNLIEKILRERAVRKASDSIKDEGKESSLFA